MSQGAIHRVFRELISSGKSVDEIRNTLKSAGAANCVINEMLGERYRRAALSQRIAEKQARRHKIPPKNSRYRRVIKLGIAGGREQFYHFTKGYRSRRA